MGLPSTLQKIQEMVFETNGRPTQRKMDKVKWWYSIMRTIQLTAHTHDLYLILPICRELHWSLMVVHLHKAKPSVVYRFDSKAHEYEFLIDPWRTHVLQHTLKDWITLMGFHAPHFEENHDGGSIVQLNLVPVEEQNDNGCGMRVT